MHITLYKNESAPNKVIKNLSNEMSVDGDFKDNIDITDIILEISVNNNLSSILKKNYAYLPILDKYYFVNNITILSRDVVLLTMHEDVLSTFLRRGSYYVGNYGEVKLLRSSNDKYINNAINDELAIKEDGVVYTTISLETDVIKFSSSSTEKNRLLITMR